MQKLQSSSEKKKKLNKSLDWEQQCIPEVAEGDIFNREEDELFAELVQARRKLHCCDEKFDGGFLTQDELKARETFADIQENFQGKRIKHYLRQFNDVKQQIEDEFTRFQDEGRIGRHNTAILREGQEEAMQAALGMMGELGDTPTQETSTHTEQEPVVQPRKKSPIAQEDQQALVILNQNVPDKEVKHESNKDHPVVEKKQSPSQVTSVREQKSSEYKLESQQPNSQQEQKEKDQPIQEIVTGETVAKNSSNVVQKPEQKQVLKIPTQTSLHQSASHQSIVEHSTKRSERGYGSSYNLHDLSNNVQNSVAEMHNQNKRRQSIIKVSSQIHLDEETSNKSTRQQMSEMDKAMIDQIVGQLCSNCTSIVSEKLGTSKISQNNTKTKDENAENRKNKSKGSLSKNQEVVQNYHEQQQREIEENKNKFKVPIEFELKYKKDRNIDASSAKVMEGLQDRIRVAYLEKAMIGFQQFHDKEMKESALRMEERMRTYAKGCLDSIKRQLLRDWKTLILQVEHLQVNEQKLMDQNLKLENLNADQMRQLTEVKTWAKYDELAHENFMTDLRRAGLTERQILDAREEIDLSHLQVEKGIYSQKEYFRALTQATIIEKEAIDFAKPFGLFNGHIKVGLSERINLLERETVKAFQKRLNECSGVAEVEQAQEKQQDDVNNMMAEDKIRLEGIIKSLKEQLAKLKIDWVADQDKRDYHLDQTVASYENNLKAMKNDYENVKSMLLKELVIKDGIIKSSDGMKSKYYRLAQELNLKLKIPRHHLEFLHNQGSLDHFVSAKITGDEVQAKWSLLKAGKKEITEIEDFNEEQRKQTEKDERDKNMLKMYGLDDRINAEEEQTIREKSIIPAESKLEDLTNISTSRLQSPDKSVNIFVTHGNELNMYPKKPPMNKETRKTSSKIVFQLDFQELLAPNEFGEQSKRSGRSKLEKLSTGAQSKTSRQLITNSFRGRSKDQIEKDQSIINKSLEPVKRNESQPMSQLSSLQPTANKDQKGLHQISQQVHRSGLEQTKYLMNKKDDSLLTFPVHESIEEQYHIENSLSDNESQILQDSKAHIKESRFQDSSISQNKAINTSIETFIVQNEVLNTSNSDSCKNDIKILEQNTQDARQQQSPSVLSHNGQRKAQLKQQLGHLSGKKTSHIKDQFSKTQYIKNSITQSNSRSPHRKDKLKNNSLEEFSPLKNQKLENLRYASNSELAIRNIEMAEALQISSIGNLQQFQQIKIKNKQLNLENMKDSLTAMEEAIDKKFSLDKDSKKPNQFMVRNPLKQSLNHSKINNKSTQQSLSIQKLKIADSIQDSIATGGAHLDLIKEQNVNKKEKILNQFKSAEAELDNESALESPNAKIFPTTKISGKTLIKLNNLQPKLEKVILIDPKQTRNKSRLDTFQGSGGSKQDDSGEVMSEASQSLIQDPVMKDSPQEDPKDKKKMPPLVFKASEKNKKPNGNTDLTSRVKPEAQSTGKIPTLFNPAHTNNKSTGAGNGLKLQFSTQQQPDGDSKKSSQRHSPFQSIAKTGSDWHMPQKSNSFFGKRMTRNDYGSGVFSPKNQTFNFELLQLKPFESNKQSVSCRNQRISIDENISAGLSSPQYFDKNDQNLVNYQQRGSQNMRFNNKFQPKKLPMTSQTQRQRKSCNGALQGKRAIVSQGGQHEYKNKQIQMQIQKQKNWQLNIKKSQKIEIEQYGLTKKEADHHLESVYGLYNQDLLQVEHIPEEEDLDYMAPLFDFANYQQSAMNQTSAELKLMVGSRNNQIENLQRAENRIKSERNHVYSFSPSHGSAAGDKQSSKTRHTMRSTANQFNQGGVFSPKGQEPRNTIQTQEQLLKRNLDAYRLIGINQYFEQTANPEKLKLDESQETVNLQPNSRKCSPYNQTGIIEQIVEEDGSNQNTETVKPNFNSSKISSQEIPVQEIFVKNLGNISKRETLNLKGSTYSLIKDSNVDNTSHLSAQRPNISLRANNMDVETVKIDPRTQQSSAIKKSRPELLESDQINFISARGGRKKNYKINEDLANIATLESSQIQKLKEITHQKQMLKKR